MNLINIFLTAIFYATSIYPMEIYSSSLWHNADKKRTLSWEQLIESNKFIICNSSPHAYDFIKKQYDAYKAQQIPKISDSCIRSIPVIDESEVTTNINFQNASEIIDINQDTREFYKMQDNFFPLTTPIAMMPSPSIPYESPECNAGLQESACVRRCIYYALAVTNQTLYHLSEPFGFKHGDVEIRVFEGLRTLRTQKKLFDNKMGEIIAVNPQLTPEQAYEETSQWVAPVSDNNIPPHSTGCAVDIRLWHNKKCHFLDLGKFGAIWGENKTAPTFSENLTDEQKKNRLYLLSAATIAGFVNYSKEYWHFSRFDQHAAYWLEQNAIKRKALFNSVVE